MPSKWRLSPQLPFLAGERQRACLIMVSSRECSSCLLQALLLFFLNFPLKASPLIWSRNVACCCHHLAGSFSLLCIPLELSSERAAEFSGSQAWMRNMHLNMRQKTPISSSAYTPQLVQPHRHPRLYSCLLPMSAEQKPLKLSQVHKKDGCPNY